jgi:hypothetical protein
MTIRGSRINLKVACGWPADQVGLQMTRILVATAGDGDDEVYVIPAFNLLPPNTTLQFLKPRNEKQQEQLKEVPLEEEIPDVHVAYSDKEVYMYPDASGQWLSSTILAMPLRPGIDHTRPGELHEYLNDEHADVVHNPDLMLEMFDRGLVYPAVYPAPIEELKKAALD